MPYRSIALPMTIMSRAVRLLLPLLLLYPLPALAQDDCTIHATPADKVQYAQPDHPWLYRGTDIPVDKHWLFGKLPNGVRYAVRENGVPPCQVSIRIRIDAGSLYEKDDERGYAHLLEHLTFRESRDFGFGQAIPYFQRLGAQLGVDTNAQTTATETVFKLDLPDARRATLADSVRAFAGMIQAPTLSQADINADLPIVLAERRDRDGPDQRIADATQRVLFKGQPVADHQPIGTLQALEHVTPKSIRAFHQRWYRPQNTVVVLVGDADPKVLAAMVERYFGKWHVPGPLTPQPDFGVPKAPPGANPKDPVGATKVLVEPGQARSITYAILRPWVRVHDNLAYNRSNLIDTIALAILNRRLEVKARAGASYLFATVNQQKISRSVDGTFVTVTPLNGNWRKALEQVRAIIAGSRKDPPTKQDIQEAVAQYRVIFQDMVDQSSIQAGSQLADDLVNAIDIRESIASPKTFQALFRSTLPLLTPKDILQHTRALFHGNVIRGVLLTPKAGEATGAQLHAALLEKPKVDDGDQDTTRHLSFADLPPIGKAHAPVSIAPLGANPLVSNVEKVTFANGVRALIRPNSNEPGRVTVRVRFGAGMRGFDSNDAVYADLGRRALVNSGLAGLDQNDLDQLASGRKMTFDFTIGDSAFQFEGLTRRQDLADQLYLFAAKLAFPSWHPAPVERAKASAILSYGSYAGDPSSVLNRDLDWLLHDRDPRFKTPTPAQMRAATPEGFRKVWSRLLQQGPVEVDVFGDIDPTATIAALDRTFGALPPRQPLPAKEADRSETFPPHNATPLVLHHDGEPDQAAAVIAWPTGGGSADLPLSRKLDVLSRILTNRLIHTLREVSGTSYSPQAVSNWPVGLKSGGNIVAMVQVDPKYVNEFFHETDNIVANLARNGPTQDELDRVLEPVRQYISRAQTGHTFWLDHIEGAAFDPAIVKNMPTLASDYLDTTPDEIKALAAKYLKASKAYRIEVLPKGDSPPVGGGQ